MQAPCKILKEAAGAVAVVLTIIAAPIAVIGTIDDRADGYANTTMVEKVDIASGVVRVRLPVWTEEMTDATCEAAGRLILDIAREFHPFQIYITNETVPSAKNPIDLEWAEKLAKGY